MTSIKQGSGMMHYLRLMGIEVWRLRAPVSNGYYRYDLLDPQNHVVGVILADAELCNEAEKQLVEKIAEATKNAWLVVFRQLL